MEIIHLESHVNNEHTYTYTHTHMDRGIDILMHTTEHMYRHTTDVHYLCRYGNLASIAERTI